MNQENIATRSVLIQILADKQGHLSHKDVEESVHCILDHMSEALQTGKRIEIRGFGAFSLRKRDSRKARNPKTGEQVSVPEKYALHFKPGKALKDNLNIK